ncbi:MAG: hypothetical protein Q8R04_03835, partial [Nanoarchaeota archaeon]|nr:hypothetical protein [Nanoarchaeota archaeon]
PSFSFFAIVVEKQKSSSALGWITFAIILIEAVVIILAYILLRRKANNLNKKDKPEGRGTASLVLGIIGIILFLFPYVGFLLAGLALVFAKIQKTIKPTGLSTAGFVLGIIGVCLNVIVSISIMLYAFF